MEIWFISWRFEFMEVSRVGAPETPSPSAQAHPHSAAQFREPKRLRSFGKKIVCDFSNLTTKLGEPGSLFGT